MIGTVLALLALAATALALLTLTLRRLVVVLRSRGELADGPDYYALDVPPRLRESRQILRAALEPDAPVDGCECEDCDDLMDVADAVAGSSPKGFTEKEAETFRRNYAPMTDPERELLDTAFRDIDRREDLTGMVRRVISEHRTQQTGADQ